MSPSQVVFGFAKACHRSPSKRVRRRAGPQQPCPCLRARKMAAGRLTGHGWPDVCSTHEALGETPANGHLQSLGLWLAHLSRQLKTGESTEAARVPGAAAAGRRWPPGRSRRHSAGRIFGAECCNKSATLDCSRMGHTVCAFTDAQRRGSCRPFGQPDVTPCSVPKALPSVMESTPRCSR